MKNRAGLPDNFDPNKVYFVKGDLLSRLCALVGGLNSDDGTVDVEYGADQIVARVAKRTAVGSMFAHPWKVTVSTSSPYTYACTDGIPSSTVAGRIWSRLGNKLDVTAVSAVAIAATKTICCEVVIPTSVGVGPSAQIVAVSGAVDYMEESSAFEITRRYPLAVVTFASGVPSVQQVRFSDIDVDPPVLSTNSIHRTVNGNYDVYDLVNDSATPGNWRYYGTNGAGAKGYYDLPTELTLEQITVISAVQYDTSSKKLQVKTRTCYVNQPSAESAWTDITTAVAYTCPET